MILEKSKLILILKTKLLVIKNLMTNNSVFNIKIDYLNDLK
jgi:hypothetical protein